MRLSPFFVWLRIGCALIDSQVKGSAERPLFPSRRTFSEVASKFLETEEYPEKYQKTFATLLLFDTALIKNAISMRIEAGKFHLHADVDEIYAKHLIAEAKERNKQGKFAWTVQGRRANQQHDAEVYAAAMADPECNGGEYVLKEPQVMPAKPVAAGAIAAQQAQVVRSNYVQSMLGNR